MSEGPGPGYGGGGGMRPVMDLSHLTAEERSIIEGVMQKQQMEENKEIRFLKVEKSHLIQICSQCLCVTLTGKTTGGDKP